MTNTDTTSGYGELETPFIKAFKELKKLRNNRHMDEPEFDERVELLAADTYAHDTREGWCCACDADIAFAASSVITEPEYKELHVQSQIALLESLLEQQAYYVGGDKYYKDVPAEVIQAKLSELKGK